MCGCQIPEGQGRRREIVTGRRSSSLRFGRHPSPSGDDELNCASQRSEMRLLCPGCAADHDAQQQRRLIIGLVVGAVALIVFGVVAFFMFRSFNSEKEKAERDFNRDRQQQRDAFERDRQRMQDDFERRKREMERDRPIPP
jgi:hypothetical protein